MATYGGLRPYTSGTSTGEPVVRGFKIANASATDLFQGDVVQITQHGEVEEGNADGDSKIVGVLAGVEYTDASGERIITNYYKGSTAPISRDDNVAYVYSDPFQLYICKVGNGSGADDVITNADVGMSIDFDVTNAGDTASGMSGVLLEDGEELADARARIVAVSNNDGTNPLTQSRASEFTHGIVQLDPSVSWLLGSGI